MHPDDPRHGTKAGYQAGCRNTCCRRAQALYTNLHRLSGPRKVPVTGTRRRVEALRWLGWTDACICRELGHERSWVRGVINAPSGMIYTTTAATIADLYDKWSMTRPEDISTRTLGFNAKHEAARNRARAKGYAPPLAWDNIDNPTEQPNFGSRGDDRTHDPVIVQRILSGEWRLPATRPEREEICAQYIRNGGTANELERLTGWNIQRYYRVNAA